MGCGCSFICKNCKEEYHVSLGEGMLSFFCDFKKILYVCPGCNNWEIANVDNKEYLNPELRKEFKEILKKNASDYWKEIIDEVEQVDHNKKCTNCGSIMKVYEDIKVNGKSSTPTLVCKKCKSKLSFDSVYCWD